MYPQHSPDIHLSLTHKNCHTNSIVALKTESPAIPNYILTISRSFTLLLLTASMPAATAYLPPSWGRIDSCTETIDSQPFNSRPSVVSFVSVSWPQQTAACYDAIIMRGILHNRNTNWTSDRTPNWGTILKSIDFQIWCVVCVNTCLHTIYDSIQCYMIVAQNA